LESVLLTIHFENWFWRRARRASEGFSWKPILCSDSAVKLSALAVRLENAIQVFSLLSLRLTVEEIHRGFGYHLAARLLKKEDTSPWQKRGFHWKACCVLSSVFIYWAIISCLGRDLIYPSCEREEIKGAHFPYHLLQLVGDLLGCVLFLGQRFSFSLRVGLLGAGSILVTPCWCVGNCKEPQYLFYDQQEGSVTLEKLQSELGVISYQPSYILDSMGELSGRVSLGPVFTYVITLSAEYTSNKQASFYHPRRREGDNKHWGCITPTWRELGASWACLFWLGVIWSL